MRNIRLTIQFDGTDFCGWQIQDNVRTVQGVLGEVVGKLTGSKVTLHSSSRTDAGVHALAMPLNFETPTDIPLRAFVDGLNSMLPHDVRVLSATDADPSFNARFRAGAKTYRYRVLNSRVALPLQRRTSWYVRSPLDIEAMRAAARHLEGEHDFTSFRSVHCDGRSPVKTIHHVEVDSTRQDIVVIEVRASGFLRNMVRIIVGTLVQVGIGKQTCDWVGEVLSARDRTVGGPTAPPQGLFLVNVEYDPVDCGL